MPIFIHLIMNRKRVGFVNGFIYISEPPHTIANFGCIIHDWDESMVCTWDLGVKYQHLNSINISLFMYVYINSNLTLNYLCQKQQASGGQTYLVGEGVILVGDQQDGGKKPQISTPVSAFSAIVGVSLKCVL